MGPRVLDLNDFHATAHIHVAIERLRLINRQLAEAKRQLNRLCEGHRRQSEFLFFWGGSGIGGQTPNAFIQTQFEVCGSLPRIFTMTST
jgi:hypothetical protein